LSEELLHFVDVCAGPGGFTKYVLWRKGWTAKGFGFTLCSSNDFRLEDFYAASPETFEPCYGQECQDNNDDVYKPTGCILFRNQAFEQYSIRPVFKSMSHETSLNFYALFITIISRGGCTDLYLQPAKIFC